MHRQIAGKLTGRVTKWIVLVAWIVALRRPRRAHRQAHRRPEQRGVVVAARLGRVDQGPRRAVRDGRPQRHPDAGRLPPRRRAHRRRPRGDGRAGRRRSPRSTASPTRGAHPQRRAVADRAPGARCFRGRRGRATSTDLQLRRRTAGTTSRRRRRDPRHRRRSTASTVHLAGFGGQAADAAEAFEGIDTNLILATLGVVIVILLFTYRSPCCGCCRSSASVVAYVVSPGVVYLLAKYADLTVNGQSQAILDHPGDRRRHRLRPAAGGPLPRGAAPARGPARGDGVRAAPRRPGDPRQRRHGRRRHALPALRRPELHRRPRPGRRRRHRGHLPGDGHPAAGAAGDLRPLDVLAEAPGVRLRRAHHDRPLGPGRRGSRPGRAGSGGHHRLLLARLPRPVQARRRRAADRGHLHQGVRLDQGPEGARRRTAWPTTPTPSRWSPTPTRSTPSQDAIADIDGLGEPTPSRGRLGDGRVLRGHHRRATSPRTAASTSSRHAATPCTPSTAPTPWSAAGRRSTSTPRSPPPATTR